MTPWRPTKRITSRGSILIQPHQLASRSRTSPGIVYACDHRSITDKSQTADVASGRYRTRTTQTPFTAATNSGELSNSCTAPACSEIWRSISEWRSTMDGTATSTDNCCGGCFSASAMTLLRSNGRRDWRHFTGSWLSGRYPMHLPAASLGGVPRSNWEAFPAGQCTLLFIRQSASRSARTKP